MSAAEVVRALALVLADVVEAGPAIQTGAGGAGVGLPCSRSNKRGQQMKTKTRRPKLSRLEGQQLHK